ncbi:hypothetical protein C0Q70_02139 [Pomacea canaliculata]|uniref:DJ-1/PfpI domain-containing protein n=1 Tax=Pomacea canaliculata TaxID=400727 RepID=A0A2T7Q1E9_POMCA|nr:hypothetical protein C0Q70_02139 [Pomacea canaliculata]
MGKKVLMVLTSHSVLGNTGKPTGWYLPEKYLINIFLSNNLVLLSSLLHLQQPHQDPASLVAFKDDAICQEFLADKEVQKQLENTVTADQVSASDFNAVFYAGGHGPMFDIPDNKPSPSWPPRCTRREEFCLLCVMELLLCLPVYHKGLVPVKLSNGKSVLEGQTVTSFTNSEEDAVDLSKAMPFMLETRLKELGAKFKAADNFQKNVVVSGRIVTGTEPGISHGYWRSCRPGAEQVVTLTFAPSWVQQPARTARATHRWQHSSATAMDIEQMLAWKNISISSFISAFCSLTKTPAHPSCVLLSLC